MSLRVRHLRIRVSTAQGVYGVDIPMNDGLVILRADNSMGKSTCIQSIIYALGLERMLSASLEVPLPPSLTRRIQTDTGEVPVLESNIYIEVENATGRRLTIQRAVAGERNRKLLSTWIGPVLSRGEQPTSGRDFFVHDSGSATREAGFHHFLAEFIGWNLPSVTRFNGTECLLYLECVFPLMIVEQKHGWSGIQANLPTFFGIKEMGKRAIEFLFRMGAPDLEIERQRLSQQVLTLRQRWTASRDTLSQELSLLGASAENFPASPVTIWPPDVAPFVSFRVDNSRFPIEEAKKVIADRLEKISKEDVPDAETAAPELSQRLQTAKEALAEVDIQGNILFEELESERLQLKAIQLRLSALEDDLKKNKDIKKLRSLGSVRTMKVSDGSCPTCHQAIVDSLLPTLTDDNPMSLDDNIAFIESQIGTFRRMELNTANVAQRKQDAVHSIRQRTDELRTEMRAIRQTLVAPSRAPSIAAIRQRIEFEDMLQRIARAQERFDIWFERFGGLAVEWTDIQDRKSKLPDAALPAGDHEKLTKLQLSFLSQLKQYGLKSVAPESLSISPETYRPARDGFNLGFDLSASDNIRTIWAYLNGLLEVARTEETNHLGMLIFDEPRQQDTARVSFDELLKRVAIAKDFPQQVIFATSENAEELTSVLKSIPHELHTFEGKILKRID